MKIKQASAVSCTLDALVNMIRSKEAGSSIPPQETLAKQFGVSRTVLREAISMLLARNVLTVRPKVGTTINPKSDWQTVDPLIMQLKTYSGQDLQHLVRVLGIDAARKAAQSMTSEAMDALQVAEYNFVNSGGAYQKRFIEFYAAVIKAANNEYVLQLLPLLTSALTVTETQAYTLWDFVFKLVDACQSKEVERAAILMAQILDVILLKDSQ